MTNPKRYYFDSCVFVSFIEGTPDRAGIIEDLLHRAEQNTIEVFTSQISIAEVVYAKQEKDRRVMSDEIRDKILALWSAESPVQQIEVFDSIAHAARDKVRWAVSVSRSLKPVDAIHFVSAEYLKVDALFTYDDKLQNHSTDALKICAPFTDPSLLTLIDPTA